MVDVPVLGTGVLRRVGSSPTKGKLIKIFLTYWHLLCNQSKIALASLITLEILIALVESVIDYSR